MASIIFPGPDDLTPLLRDLFTTNIAIEPGVGAPDADPSRMRALVSDDNQPLVLCSADLPFAMHAGAALAMIRPDRAEKAITVEENDDDLLEIYFEVLNVLAHAVSDCGNPHVRMIPGSTMDGIDIAAFDGTRVPDVTIQGYGSGRLGFWRRSAA